MTEDTTTTNGGPAPMTWHLEGLGYQPEATFLRLMSTRGYRHRLQEQRATGANDDLEGIRGLGSLELEVRSKTRVEIVLAMPSACMRLLIGPRSASADAAGVDPAALEALIDEAFDRLPRPEPMAQSTPLTFWAWNQRTGASATHRRIDPRSWDEVEGGYSETVAERLSTLTMLQPPPRGGRLLLWHGEPGTGKTHAVRALAHAWREWCAVHVVTDPECLLDGGNGYLLELMATRDFEQQAKREWKLVVLEDSGELLTADARERAGQGLSRLLNVSDGLLGTGTNTMFLITTNEPLGGIHPAVHRPGRCLAEIEFTALDPGRADSWLAERGIDERVNSPATLAELYSMQQGRGRRGGVGRRRAVGFAA